MKTQQEFADAAKALTRYKIGPCMEAFMTPRIAARWNSGTLRMTDYPRIILLVRDSLNGVDDWVYLTMRRACRYDDLGRDANGRRLDMETHYGREYWDGLSAAAEELQATA
jgi:hypothetical protein